MQELIDDGKPLTSREIGKAMGCSHTTIQKLQRRPGFLAWLTRELQAVRVANRTLIERRFEVLAMRGSVDHAEFLAKVNQWGGYGKVGVAGDRGAGGMGGLIPPGTSISNFNLVLGVPLTPPVDQEKPGGLPLPVLEQKAG